jgi:hypothetical protein
LKSKSTKRLQDYEKVKKKEIERLDYEFKKVMSNLKDRKMKLKNEFLKYYDDETKGLIINIQK